MTYSLPRKVDVLVVGGGITGVGIALDLATRGLQTLVIERSDWAGATSSSSSRLIHGGLRYLEQFELSLVRESCLERALLLKNAAGYVWPETFHFPIFRGGSTRRAKLNAGLWLYTLLSTPRALGLPKARSSAAIIKRLPMIDRHGLMGGGSYLDAATNDARLTLAVMQTARQHGATCRSQVELLQVNPTSSGATALVRDSKNKDDVEIAAKAVVLAGGPTTDELRRRAGLLDRHPWLAPTRGSHIIVPRKRLPTDGAAIFTSSLDERVMFLVPWPRHTIIGTTDLDANLTAPPRATGSEVRYLLDSANALSPSAELTASDVVSTWSGLRPLLAPKRSRNGEPSLRSREERIEREGAIFTIAGGKLTSYRRAAEKLAVLLTRDLGIGESSRHSKTRGLRLYGALGARVPRPAWSRLKHGRPRDLDPLAIAFASRYGAHASRVRSELVRNNLDERLDATTYLGELDLCVRDEDVLNLTDFIFRRTDLGLTGQIEPKLERLATRLAGLLGWQEERRKVELEATRTELRLRSAWQTDST